DGAARVEDDGGRGPDEPDDERALGDRRLLAHAVLEIRVRTVQADRDAARDLLDLRRELLVRPDADVRSTGEQLDRPVVVCRAEPARDDEQVAGEAFAERLLEVGGVVAHDRDACGVDAEPQERRREERAVAVVPVAGDELRARCDDRRSYAGRQPVGVTMMTCGFRPGTWTSL